MPQVVFLFLGAHCNDVHTVCNGIRIPVLSIFEKAFSVAKRWFRVDTEAFLVFSSQSKTQILSAFLSSSIQFYELQFLFLLVKTVTVI